MSCISLYQVGLIAGCECCKFNPKRPFRFYNDGMVFPLKNESDKIMNKLIVIILPVLLVLSFHTGPGLIRAEKEHGSATREVGPSDVRVEWVSRNMLKMAQAPLDVEISADGKWIFVLTRQGNPLVA